MKKYDLFTGTLAIANERRNHEHQRRNLDKIWIEIKNEEKFRSYIQQEIENPLMTLKI